MIDITIGKDTIEVEMKMYYLDYSKLENNQTEIIKALEDIITKVKYSGETISLWKATEYEKVFIREWH